MDNFSQKFLSNSFLIVREIFVAWDRLIFSH